jgi:hypothetical protein
MITELEKAYLAGIVDGEGCIYVDRFKDYRNKTGNFAYVLRLKVSMTCEKTINWIYETVSKEFQCCKVFKAKGKEFQQNNRKPVYEFKFSKNLLKFLKYIHPYMVTKKDRALAAFEWEDTKFDNNLRGRNCQFLTIPKNLLEKKEEIYQKFRVLNKTGR